MFTAYLIEKYLQFTKGIPYNVQQELKYVLELLPCVC